MVRDSEFPLYFLNSRQSAKTSGLCGWGRKSFLAVVVFRVWKLFLYSSTFLLLLFTTLTECAFEEIVSHDHAAPGDASEVSVVLQSDQCLPPRLRLVQLFAGK